MPRHSGRRGKIKAQAGGLTTITREELTPQAGNQRFDAVNSPWARSEPGFPCVLPDGLLLGGSVNPTTNDDEVTVEGGSVQIGGNTVVFSGAVLSSVARPVTPGNTLISAVTVDSTGTLALVAGTEGTAGGARGAAGGPPYIPVSEVLLAYITLTGTAAAVIVGSEIDVASAERAAIPGWVIDYINGYVTFSTALEAIHTGDTLRKVYATYKFMTLMDVGDLFDWSLDHSTDQIENSAFDDDYKDNEDGMAQWSGNFNGYHVNSYWYNQATTLDGAYFIELYDDRRVSNRFRGFAKLDWGISVAKDAMVTESITYTGRGPLERTGTYGSC